MMTNRLDINFKALTRVLCSTQSEEKFSGSETAMTGVGRTPTTFSTERAVVE